MVQAVGPAADERLLDVGGGSAAYSIAFAKADEKLHATVLDLPTVLPIAQRHINAAGLAGRVETRAGDLRRDPLGNGFTLVLVSAICHMLSPEENQDLLRRCYEALDPHGRVVIQDFILESDKTAPEAGRAIRPQYAGGNPRRQHLQLRRVQCLVARGGVPRSQGHPAAGTFEFDHWGEVGRKRKAVGGKHKKGRFANRPSASRRADILTTNSSTFDFQLFNSSTT